MNISTEFGYCPDQHDWIVGDIHVSTLPGLPETADAVSKNEGVEGAWIYAPRQRTQDFMSGAVTEQPYSARVFGLPMTHLLEHQSADSDEHVHFLVWCLGFLLGLRLTHTEAGFLDATPIKPGTLHDIVWCGKDSIPKALGCADQFWGAQSSNARVPKAITGIIHSLFLAQNPTALMFEKFTYLYIALDGCHFVSRSMFGQKPKYVRHKERIDQLCNAFGMAVPKWANPATTSIADYRGETLHEGLFFDEPLGFASYGGASQVARSENVVLQMQALVCRFLFALLGIPAVDYIRSPVNMRSQHGVTI